MKRRLLRTIHRWLGLLIGLQVLAWFSGGLLMSLMPIEDVRGDSHVDRKNTAVGSRLSEFRIAPAAITGAGAGDTFVMAIRLGEPVYLLQRDGHTLRAIHAQDGRELPALDGPTAARIAREAHREHPAVLDTTLLPEPPDEARGLQGPLWRISLADRWSSNVYIDPVSARVLLVRNDLWRVFDIAWMLHIMDFGAREDINNPLLRSSALFAWLLGLSGAWLVFYSFARRRGNRQEALAE